MDLNHPGPQPRTQRAAVAQYLSRPPWQRSGAPGLGGADPAHGQQVFQNGVAARGLIACQVCHGAGAQGNRRNDVPFLAGHNPQYLLGKLKEYKAEAQLNPPPAQPNTFVEPNAMHAELEPLDLTQPPDQALIRDVVAYLNSLQLAKTPTEQ